jgi:hypothetical protein
MSRTGWAWRPPLQHCAAQTSIPVRCSDSQAQVRPHAVTAPLLLQSRCRSSRRFRCSPSASRTPDPMSSPCPQKPAPGEIPQQVHGPGELLLWAHRNGFTKRLSCHICQEVCPFPLRFAEPAREPGYAARGPGEAPVGVEAKSVSDVSNEMSSRPSGDPLHPGTDAPSLVALLDMVLDPEAWEAFSRGSAIRRAGRAGFARNVCVAMGNWLASAPPGAPPEGAIDALAAALFDPEPLVRGHAAWALGRAAGASAVEVLAFAAASESDPWVAEELEAGRSGRGVRETGGPAGGCR